eukprot:COSAG05_NODE_1013_length_6190_cov_4.171236_2_plen_109_part_00
MRMRQWASLSNIALLYVSHITERRLGRQLNQKAPQARPQRTAFSHSELNWSLFGIYSTLSITHAGRELYSYTRSYIALRGFYPGFKPFDAAELSLQRRSVAVSRRVLQ